MYSYSALSQVIKYCIKFLLLYVIFYYGTKAIIGLTVPGGYYSNFVFNYFNYPAILRSFLLRSAHSILALFKIQTFLVDSYRLKLIEGGGVRMVYDCLGFGLISFWLAFVIANAGRIKTKIFFVLIGTLVILSINIVRITILVISIHNKWEKPMGLEHHTLFNIIAYAVIFFMMFVFDRNLKGQQKAT